MKRSLCYLAPHFDRLIIEDIKVRVTIRNRKGKVKEKFIGRVYENRGTLLSVINPEWDGKIPITIYATDVYNGKVGLELIEEE